METNQTTVQEQSAQTILPETGATVQSEQQTVPPAELPTEKPASEPPQATQSAELLYDPAEAAQIVHHLTDDYFDPEYILLFGKLVGGIRHSDATAYDLLMVVRETPEFNWIQTKRILRYKMPYRLRKITYINIYILPLNYVESHWTPFLHFARAEGELLYCSDHYHFRRPKYAGDFAKAYADAKFHFDTFRMLGYDLLEQAQEVFVEDHNVRLAAQFTAQAIVYFYHTLYYVYHGMEFDIHDPDRKSVV